MALQSSGSISFSQIATEFGGSGSHSLSEYYPLVGQGVSGLPSSGQFSFSQFHGKSKTVVTSTWTSSGYNTASWVNSSTYYSEDHAYYATFGGTFLKLTTWGITTQWGVSSYISGNTRYSTTGTNIHCGNNGCRQSIQLATLTNTWTDTSSYVNVTTTASITG